MADPGWATTTRRASVVPAHAARRAPAAGSAGSGAAPARPAWRCRPARGQGTGAAVRPPGGSPRRAAFGPGRRATGTAEQATRGPDAIAAVKPIRARDEEAPVIQPAAGPGRSARAPEAERRVRRPARSSPPAAAALHRGKSFRRSTHGLYAGWTESAARRVRSARSSPAGTRTGRQYPRSAARVPAVCGARRSSRAAPAASDWDRASGRRRTSRGRRGGPDVAVRPSASGSS